MAEFPALPLWTDALIGDTHHLTTAQFGAYMRLLITEWRRPNCDLPGDDLFLGRCVGDPKNWHRLKPVVMPFFDLGPDGLYRQKRLLREREYVSRIAGRAAAGGRAKARKYKKQASAKQVLNECLTPAPTPTPTPTPVESKDSSSKSPKGDFEGFWILCPRKVGKGAARKAYAKALRIAPEPTLHDGMRRYAATRKGEPEAYTVHPATWLNQERWLDAGKGNGASMALVLTDDEQREEQEALKRLGVI